MLRLLEDTLAGEPVGFDKIELDALKKHHERLAVMAEDEGDTERSLDHAMAAMVAQQEMGGTA